jgi:hypothetical protein
MGIYTIVESTDKKTIFYYCIIIIFSIYFFRSKNIGLNVILALFLGTVIISYIHERSEIINDTEQKERKLKINTIKPPTKYFENKDDVINFFFSVQDFYHLNPQVYEDVIDNVDAFLNIHRILNIGTDYSEDYYQIAKDKKSEALNSFQALIYSLPDNTIILEKHERANKRLETILNKYLNEMYDICGDYIIKHGYNIYRHPINIGPDGYNKEVDEEYVKVQKDFSYKFY